MSEKHRKNVICLMDTLTDRCHMPMTTEILEEDIQRETLSKAEIMKNSNCALKSNERLLMI